MKAKVKSLGSVTDLSEYIYDEDGNEYTWNEIELIDDDKWQQVRIQAAIAAMQGQLANHVLTENMIESVENVANFPKVVANASVRFADALIAELQKKGGEQ